MTWTPISTKTLCYWHSFPYIIRVAFKHFQMWTRYDISWTQRLVKRLMIMLVSCQSDPERASYGPPHRGPCLFNGGQICCWQCACHSKEKSRPANSLWHRVCVPFCFLDSPLGQYTENITLPERMQVNNFHACIQIRLPLTRIVYSPLISITSVSINIIICLLPSQCMQKMILYLIYFYIL